MSDDVPVDPAVSARFARTQGKDTQPELLVRRALHRHGLRFRVHVRPIPSLRRSGDIVFTKCRVVVLIDGCFFHGCPIHYVPPKTRTDVWTAKIQGNVARDLETSALFEAEGWVVLRFWEHEPVDRVVAQIEATLLRARGLQ